MDSGGSTVLSNRPRKILLTGFNGFVGANLIKRYAETNTELVVVGRTKPELAANVHFVSADLSLPGDLARALRQKACCDVDTIVHLAVSRHHRNFPERALDMFYVNSAAAVELLDFARRSGVKQAVFGSTGTVYSSSGISSDLSVPNLEEEFNKPNSFFAASKLFPDTLCDFYREFLTIATLRLYTPYGPGLEDRLLADLVNRVKLGIPLTLPRSGPGMVFAATYIDDILNVIEISLANAWNETVNIACPGSLTVQGVGELVGQIIGKAPIFERTDAPYGPKIVPNLDCMKHLMPSYAFMRFEQGLRKMIDAM